MSQGEFYISNKNGHKINPATEEGSTLILNEVVQSKDKNSLDFGTELLSVVALAVGISASDQPCRTAYVSATAKVNVENFANGPADAASFYIPKDTVVEIPVRNTNKLSFYSAAGASVHILWRD